MQGNNNSWVHVPPISGSLVINVGDALQIMSNGPFSEVLAVEAGIGFQFRFLLILGHMT